jgi:hypothetical protein
MEDRKILKRVLENRNVRMWVRLNWLGRGLNGYVV